MSFQSIPYPVADDEPWFDVEMPRPPNVPESFLPATYEIPHHILCVLDRRLSDYRARIMLSELTPDDPSDWARFTVDWPGLPREEYRLWRLWVRYRDAPMIGELQYVAGYGWMDTVYRPHWFPRMATTKEYEKTARGLDLLLQRIQRPGREPTYQTPQDCRIALVTTMASRLQNGQRVSKAAVGLMLSGDPSGKTIDRWLKRYGLDWNSLCAEAQQQAQKPRH
jgi:hypothetical protein